MYLVTFTEEILHGKLHFLCSDTHINIHPVAILEQLLVLWQLIQPETIDTITITVFTKIETACQNLSFKLV